tara:strand:+ start:1636 stop:2163 length:528 start_codon:yes stop_codon:yes gene_type:complete
MSKILKLHNSCASQHKVLVEWKVEGDYVHFDFEVSNYKPHQNQDFGKDYKENWGLWESDVVEIFLKREDSQDYLEVQTSPLNQPFGLVIEEPRVKWHVPEVLDLAVSNITLGSSWKSTLSIGLNFIPGNSKKIIGNCFACLGNKESREYFALNINTEETPDFHRPELFVDMGVIK